WLGRFRIVFCETVEERHDDATFGLARWYLRVQRLRFVAGDIAKNVSGRRSSAAEVSFVLCRRAATRKYYRNRYQRDDELNSAGDGRNGFHTFKLEIGRASCRERGEIWGGGGVVTRKAREASGCQ